MLQINYTTHFAKHFQKLPQRIKLKAYNQEQKFRKSPLDPSLKTHKLSGKLSPYYSFSITYEYRIMFSFETDESVTFIDVGTHEIYK